jgi:hypothetical protein
MSTPHPITDGNTGTLTPADGNVWIDGATAGVQGTVVMTHLGEAVGIAIEVGNALHTGVGHPGAPGATAGTRAVWIGWLQRGANLDDVGKDILGQAITWVTFVEEEEPPPDPEAEGTLYAAYPQRLFRQTYAQFAALPSLSRVGNAYLVRSGRAVDSPGIVARVAITVDGTPYAAGASLAALNPRVIRRLLRTRRAIPA